MGYQDDKEVGERWIITICISLSHLIHRYRIIPPLRRCLLSPRSHILLHHEYSPSELLRSLNNQLGALERYMVEFVVKE